MPRFRGSPYSIGPPAGRRGQTGAFLVICGLLSAALLVAGWPALGTNKWREYLSTMLVTFAGLILTVSVVAVVLSYQEQVRARPIRDELLRRLLSVIVEVLNDVSMVVGFPTLITGRPSQELVDRGKELEGNLRLKLVGTVGTTSQAEIDQYKKLGRDVLGLIGNINAALSFEIVPLLLELGEDPELLRRTMVFNATVYQRRNLDRPTETLSFFGDLAQTATNVAERLHVIYGTDPAWDPVFEPTQFPWTISFPKLPTLGHRKGSLWRTAQHWCRRHKRRPSGRESVDASIEGES